MARCRAHVTLHVARAGQSVPYREEESNSRQAVHQTFYSKLQLRKGAQKALPKREHVVHVAS